MSFGKKFLSWIFNDLIVHRLANNRNFQKFAVTVDSQLTKSKKLLEDQIKEKNIKIELGTIKATANNFAPFKFVRNFFEEVRQEMKNIKEIKK